MIQAFNIEFDYERCHKCGRIRYVEKGFIGKCPKCAQDTIHRLERDNERLERQVRAYKAIFKHKGEKP